MIAIAQKGHKCAKNGSHTTCCCKAVLRFFEGANFLHKFGNGRIYKTCVNIVVICFGKGALHILCSIKLKTGSKKQRGAVFHFIGKRGLNPYSGGTLVLRHFFQTCWFIRPLLKVSVPVAFCGPKNQFDAAK